MTDQDRKKVGRKTIGNQVMKVLPVRMEPIYIERLKQKAQLLGMPASQIVRDLVVDYLEKSDDEPYNP
ncbi:hypothetical protein ACFOZ5_17305 [Marinobacter lacisalsi]|uniref:Ribbon-helix-helix protein CopG domain-containing protein n=1 Tax=Marinobacter lacisalsi TaxID=475979 RepID=A0ABV8QMI3_9GAMM